MFLFDLHPCLLQRENVLRDSSRITHKDCSEVRLEIQISQILFTVILVPNAEPRTAVKLGSNSHIGYKITIFVA